MNRLSFVLDSEDLLFLKCENQWLKVKHYDIIFKVSVVHWAKKLEAIEFRALRNLLTDELTISKVEVSKESINPSTENNWIMIDDIKNIPIPDIFWLVWTKSEIIGMNDNFRAELFPIGEE